MSRSPRAPEKSGWCAQASPVPVPVPARRCSARGRRGGPGLQLRSIFSWASSGASLHSPPPQSPKCQSQVLSPEEGQSGGCLENSAWARARVRGGEARRRGQ